MLFCVDASGSMAARKRMEQVKTAVLSLLLDAYQRRDKVGLVTFRGDRRRARAAADALGRHRRHAARRRSRPAAARRWPRVCSRPRRVLELERLRDPRRRPLLVVVTDGRATAGADAVARSRQAAARLAAPASPAVVVDCETGPHPARPGRRARRRSCGAEHVPVGEVSAARAHRPRPCTGRGGWPDAAGTSRSSCPTTGSPPGSAATGRC